MTVINLLFEKIFKIKNDYNDYKYAISLIEYYGGKVKEPLFGYKFKVRFDGKKFVIDGFIELCEFALKTYEDKFNS